MSKSKRWKKIHVAMNHKGNLREFVTVTEARTHEINEGRRVNLTKGGIVASDREYTEYEWYKSISDKGIYVVAQLMSNATTHIVERREVDRSKGLSSDHTIEFTGVMTSKRCPITLRRVRYRDLTIGKRYEFLPNNFSLAYSTIAAIYKSHLQIELFFKWIKQNLKIKSFMGTSKNAVMTQIWIVCLFFARISEFCVKSEEIDLTDSELVADEFVREMFHFRSVTWQINRKNAYQR